MGTTPAAGNEPIPISSIQWQFHPAGKKTASSQAVLAPVEETEFLYLIHYNLGQSFIRIPFDLRPQ